MTIKLPTDEGALKEQAENAKYVRETPIPDKFEWFGKGDEPGWFQEWVRKKAEYVKMIAERVGYLPDTIMLWKMEKIKDVYSEEAIDEFVKNNAATGNIPSD